MTAAVEIDFSQYTGKKVVVTRNLEDGTAGEIEGTVQIGSAIGLLLKPKGKSGAELIEAESIEQVVEQAEAPKKLTRKVLKPIPYGQARTHLLERHGATLTDINGVSEEEALAIHAEIDHEADDLGHTHKAPEDAAEAPTESAPAE